MTYSIDRRQVLIWRYEETKSIRAAAKSCRVSKSTAQRWIADSIRAPQNPKIRKVRRSTKINRVIHLVEKSLLDDPFKSCLDLSRSFSVSKELIRRCVHILGFSCKKARYYGVSKNASVLTTEFIRRRDQYIKESRPIYSVDETGFGRFSYQHRKGWALVGKELRVRKKFARQTSTTVLACSSDAGWVKTMEVNGGVNRLTFCSFISSLDVPRGSVILLDNASKTAFNSLTVKHFEAFFRRSLSSTGIDCDAFHLQHENCQPRSTKKPPNGIKDTSMHRHTINASKQKPTPSIIATTAMDFSRATSTVTASDCALP